MLTGILNYITLLAVVIFALLFYHNYVVFLLLVILVLIPIYTGISTYVLAKQLKVTAKIRQSSVARQHNIHLNLGVDNPTLFSADNVIVTFCIYNAFYGNEEHLTVTVPATAREERIVSWEFASDYCGRVIVEIESVRLVDILGIFHFSCHGKASGTEVLVMPDIQKIEDKLEVESEGDGEQPQVQYRKGSDVSEVSEIREYIPGDKLQTIHWKLSAKQDKMMVKEYSMPYTNEFILIPELYYDGKKPQILDDILNVLYSYAHVFLKEQREFYIGWINGGTGEVFSAKIETDYDITAVMKQLFYSKLETFPGQAREYFGHAGKYEGKTVVYIGEAVVECLS